MNIHHIYFSRHMKKIASHTFPHCDLSDTSGLLNLSQATSIPFQIITQNQKFYFILKTRNTEIGRLKACLSGMSREEAVSFSQYNSRVHSPIFFPIQKCIFSRPRQHLRIQGWWPFSQVIFICHMPCPNCLRGQATTTCFRFLPLTTEGDFSTWLE